MRQLAPEFRAHDRPSSDRTPRRNRPCPSLPIPGYASSVQRDQSVLRNRHIEHFIRRDQSSQYRLSQTEHGRSLPIWPPTWVIPPSKMGAPNQDRDFGLFVREHSFRHVRKTNLPGIEIILCDALRTQSVPRQVCSTSCHRWQYRKILQPGNDVLAENRQRCPGGSPVSTMRSAGGSRSGMHAKTRGARTPPFVRRSGSPPMDCHGKRYPLRPARLSLDWSISIWTT